MRWSKAFLPTLRDDPADAEAASHRLLLRAGYVRQLGAGIYSMLPLGQRVLARIATILRDEMARVGAQEFHLPALHPAELWKESGRWEEMGDEMFRLRDRKQADHCLGMTHEEVFTAIARDELRSYRALPQTWYQIQSKFRDEPRPKAGVLRGRQFTMKDSYSFDLDEAGLDASFDAHAQAYRRIFARCGLEALPVEASSGAMGGSESVEFMGLADVGEDWVVRCKGCGYAANLEKARSTPPEAADPADAAAPERFPTPGVRTIEDLAQLPGGAPADRQIKTLAYRLHDELALVLLRGDHALNEVKLVEVAGATAYRPCQPDEIRAHLGAGPGSLGAVGVTGLRIYADQALRGRRGMVTGANEDGFHLRHVDVERDIEGPLWCDLRSVQAGEACTACGKPLEVHRAIELGHIFKLGTRYSAKMGATVLGPDGKERPIVMGSYGIGLERIMAAVIEAHHDENGIRWPASVAPYSVVISPPRMNDAAQAEAAESLYAELLAAGVDVLLDDRDERAGVKFKDADLIGIPYRIVPGPRALGRGCVELVDRAAGSMVELPIAEVGGEIARRLRDTTAG
jgi:prolyl-tRNA synthetase